MTSVCAFADALHASAIEPRADLVEALDIAWRRLAEPGEWLTGRQRIAVAKCARQAWACNGCDVRKAALSPYAPAPDHTGAADLDPAWVDVIHFTIRDSGRMTQRVYDEALAAGMNEDEFVEVITVAILTQTMDAFAFGIGLPQLALPAPVEGAPPRVRAEKATPGPGWVPTIAPEDASPDFVEFYDNEYYFFIRRALTLVPRQTRQYWDLTRNLYLEDPRIPELEGLERSISRSQMEFLAARASALLGCYY